MLAAVATRIAAMRANVVGLEVLERSGGVAVDELTVEMPETGSVVPLTRQLGTIDGACIEQVQPVPPDQEGRGLQVIAAAISILETANASASLSAVVGFAEDLFDAEWSALVDIRSRTYVHCTGDVPGVEWLLDLVAGAAGAPAVDGAGRSVIAGELDESDLILSLGRTVPFRRREQRELDMLARVADRMCRPLRGDRIPASWGSSPRFPGG